MKYKSSLLMLTLNLLLITGCSNSPKSMPESMRQSVTQQFSTINSCANSKHYSKSDTETLVQLIVGLNSLKKYAIDTKKINADVVANSKATIITKHKCAEFSNNVVAIAATRLKANLLEATSSASSSRTPYKYKSIPNMSLPNAPSVNSWTNKPVNRPATVYYNSSDCLGSVVDGRCMGTIRPSAKNDPLLKKCYGVMVNNRCNGATGY